MHFPWSALGQGYFIVQKSFSCMAWRPCLLFPSCPSPSVTAKYQTWLLTQFPGGPVKSSCSLHASVAFVPSLVEPRASQAANNTQRNGKVAGGGQREGTCHLQSTLPCFIPLSQWHLQMAAVGKTYSHCTGC